MQLGPLSHVLRVKIAVTVAAWCVPLLFFPASLLEHLGFPPPQPKIFLHLLGMAFARVLVGSIRWRPSGSAS